MGRPPNRQQVSMSSVWRVARCCAFSKSTARSWLLHLSPNLGKTPGRPLAKDAKQRPGYLPAAPELYCLSQLDTSLKLNAQYSQRVMHLLFKVANLFITNHLTAEVLVFLMPWLTKSFCDINIRSWSCVELNLNTIRWSPPPFLLPTISRAQLISRA